MSPEQCRAARAWLNLSQQDLAEAANVAISTIKDFESGRRNPMAKNLFAMRRELERLGVQFTVNGTSVGISADLKAKT